MNGKDDLVSVLISPPIFTLALLLVLYLLAPDSMLGGGFFPVGLVAILALVLLPVAPVLVGFYMGKNDLNVSDIETRRIMLLYSTVSYFASAGLFYAFGNKVLVCISAVYGLVTLAVLLLSFFYKVSVHVAGAVSTVTMLVMLTLNKLFLPLYFVTALVGWQRLRTRAHTMLEVALGGLASVLTTAVSLTLLLSFL